MSVAPPDGARGHFPLELRHIFRAAPERVFSAFTNPQSLHRWWCGNGEDGRVRTVDARVGGRYEMEIFLPDGAVQLLFGEYLEVEPPRRLVFTWNWTAGDLRGQESRVTMEFHRQGDGTELALLHEPFADDPDRAQHRRGWEMLFSRLAADLQRSPP